ncbi:proton channel OTOP2-like isoform X1 [Salarias fasciatus]|uniref:proton channel OTOP2-like isoform X1 n=2 Tax=Salarias fasciatus TaxID=181472 RepID=UPI001176F735|nr:proton channel OTOP2-like isoform X1 [Salarias fasciatus]
MGKIWGNICFRHTSCGSMQKTVCSNTQSFPGKPMCLSSKVHPRCLQSLSRLTSLFRCGLTLTLSTNLVVWMAAVTEESVHHTEIPHLAVNVSHKTHRASHGDVKCECSHTLCDTFQEAFFYLYPFNIEYSLFASAMTYVMWKNVGRIVESHGHHKAKFRLKDALVGSVSGSLLVIAGLTTFILYELDIVTEDKQKREKVLLMHFVMNIVIVSLMSVCTVIGCVVYRLDHRQHISEKNPSHSLDVGLLVGASMGQLIISYFTIVAVVATGAKGYMNALNLTLAVVVVLQLGLQNYFIIEGLHREPFHAIQEAALRTNGQAFQEHPEVNTAVGLNSCSNKLNWKRKVLKEVCAFLLFSNVILWIMPAFGARPQFDHHVETHFYKHTMWTSIVNIGLPFGIFYRMHCIASLFEVYLMS